ncbi:MAG: N-acetyltransferase [Planctomycetota bacterium]|nr:MAG: N-acetyltransferase [Planctomycetota bacterium]
MNIQPIVTPRLELVRATVPVLRAAALENRFAMAEMLAAQVTEDWPPQFMDDACAMVADQLDREPEPGIWSMWFVLQRGPRVLVGTFGFKAPPADGRVDLGYSIVASHQKRGYATEATRAMIDLAFAQDGVRTIVGETFDELVASIRVLEKCGFARCAAGVTGFSGEENVVRYELPRERWRPAGEKAREVL